MEEKFKYSDDLAHCLLEENLDKLRWVKQELNEFIKETKEEKFKYGWGELTEILVVESLIKTITLFIQE